MSIARLTSDSHWKQIVARIRHAPADERHAVIFIHGYNVTFTDAALRAAQLGVDLSISGAMAFFSWPSKGTYAGYPADEASIDASEGPLADYLTDFATHSGAAIVHVIAHSMGNRGFLRAVTRIAADAERRSGVAFGQFLLAAPDVDATVFRELCSAYRKVARRTTLYVSARDRAVSMSEWLHSFPRAGYIPPVLVADGIDTVNVTDVDLTLLGHGYVGDARAVLSDMHTLIRRNVPPEGRFGIGSATTAEGEKYWTIGR